MGRAIGRLAGGLVLAVAAVGIVFVTGMRRKSPLVLDAVRWTGRAMKPLVLRSSGTPAGLASVVRHVGRKTGRPYETPVQAVATEDGFVIALPYGPNTRPSGARRLIRRFATADAPDDRLAAIRRLLDRAFGGDFSDDDWAHALGGTHVVVEDGGAVVGHAAVVPRTIEVAGRSLRTGYVEAVATEPARQREGLGRRVMAEVAEIVRDDFELGALSTGRHRFYEGLGWERWRGPTSVRHGPAAVRTPDEDDGVMVLRVGPSRDLDLRAPISCEARRGDDW